MCTSFLFDSYDKVDLFDRCLEGVQRAKRAMQVSTKCGTVSQASMQSFCWTFDYSAIFLVWCAGYLGHASLVNFLRKAKLHLSKNSNRRSRRDEPDSFIIVLDNVLSDGEEPERVKGQRIRSE